MGLDTFLRRLALSGDDSWSSALQAAAISVGVCGVVRLLAQPLLVNITGLVVFFPALVFAAVWAGRRAAVLAVVLSVVAGTLLAWMTADAFSLARAAVGIAFFVFSGGLVASVAAAFRAMVRRYDASLEDHESARQRLRLAHEAGALGTWEWNLATDRLTISDGYRRNWGQDIEDGVPFLELMNRVHPEDIDGVRVAREHSMSTGEPYLSEYRVANAEGGFGWFQSKGEAVRDVSGALTGFIGVNRNITDQKLAEASLRESEARFRLIADSAPVMLWMGDEQGGGVYLNRVFRQFWGDRTSDQLMGRAWLDAVHPEDRPKLDSTMARGIASREPFQVEARMRRADGAWRLIQATVMPRFSASEHFRGIIGVGADVTDSRAAEVALRESEERFRAMADSAPAPVWVAGPRGGIEFVNRAMREFVGGDTVDVLGVAWVDLVHPDDKDRLWAVREAAHAAGEPMIVDARFRNAAGDWRWMSINTQPRRDEAGEVVGYVGIAFDITETRRSRDTLEADDRRQRFLLELGDRLREHAEPSLILRAAVEALGEHLQVDRAGYGEIDETGDTISVNQSWAAPGAQPLEGVWPLESFGPDLIAVVRRGEIGMVEDVTRDARVGELGGRNFSAIGTRALLSVPLVRAGRLRALLNLHMREPRAWTAEEAELVQEVAARTWAEVERARAEVEVRESEARFRSIADSAPVLVWVTAADRSRAFVNRTYVDFFGGDYRTALTADWRSMLHPDDIDRVLAESIAGEASLQPFALEARYLHHDGSYRWLRSYSRPRLDGSGVLMGFVGMAYDVTEAKQVATDLTHINELLEERVSAALAEKAEAEAALMHAQKMEAVGRLTGGVAHDFNNLLTVVIGALDMIMKPGVEEGRRRKMGEAALAAARRGERLTHQLLAFSRRQTLRPQLCDVNALIREGEPLLRRAVGEAVALKLKIGKRPAFANVDPGQFEAALLNLLVNARDATPDGGHIRIQTTAVTLAERDVPETAPGDYVCILVEDTGAGMTAEVLQRVFEPFFTTKAVGKGTGLGLSQVYGFARQSGGGVRLESAPGEGAAVRLFLPARPAATAAVSNRLFERQGGDGERLHGLHALLVEDDDGVGDMAAIMLENLGISVQRAADAAEALDRLERTRFDLMLSDVVMPGGVSGFELARRAAAHWPDMLIVLSSGYAGDEAIDAELATAPWPFLRKPYAAEELQDSLTQALDRRPEAAL